VWLINADLGYSVLEPFAERFPERYLNVGVAEQNMVGVAAGLALSGFKPFVYSIANFPTQRCLEQIRVDVCYHDAPVTIVAVGGGFAYGSQGYTHHAIEDLAVMRALPGMRVAAPADPVETAACVREFVSRPGPSYLRLGRGGEPILHTQALASLPVGPIRMRDGDAIALVSTGAVLAQVLAAADRLAEEGLTVRVLSLPLLKPLDEDGVIAEIRGLRLVATIEEHSLIGGLRDTLAPIFASHRDMPRLISFGVKDGATKGVILDQANMLRHCGLDASSLYEGVKSALC
jgi:transketolase